MSWEAANGPFGKLLFLADVIHVIVDDLDGLVRFMACMMEGLEFLLHDAEEV